MHAAVTPVLAAALCLAAPLARGPLGPRPQSGSIHPDPKVEYKLRHSRANKAYRELVESAAELGRASSELSRRVADRGAVAPEDRKAIEQIRRLAKKVRADLGGSGDPSMDDPPATPLGAVAALEKRAVELAGELEGKSRFELNARLVVLATEVLYLSDMLAATRGR